MWNLNDFSHGNSVWETIGVAEINKRKNSYYSNAPIVSIFTTVKFLEIPDYCSDFSIVILP